MNLNVGGFSESLTCSYQQFCKQEAEGRDFSRRLLVKLKKFEAKAFGLVAQTQSAQLMRNQFEKMLMQQNPLFWAQLQRNIATDVTEFNFECSLAGCSGMKHTREMAVNTSCNSLISEPHSTHEEGIWPHTPSPTMDMDLQQLTNDNTRDIKMFSSTPYVNDNKEYKNMKTHKKKTDINLLPTNKEVINIPCPQGNDKTEHSSTSIEETYQTTQNIIIPQQVNQYVSESNAALNSTIKDEVFGLLPPSFTANANIEPLNERLLTTEIKHPSMGMTEVLVTDPITCKHQDTNNDKEDFIKALQFETTAMEEVTVPVSAPASPNKMKPFRLNSDSDCGEDPISGPLSGKNVGDDDSDSFWN